MKRVKRNPFFLVLVVAASCAVVMLGGGYLLSRRIYTPPSLPETLKKAEVKEGGDWLGKSLLYEARSLGTITDLRYDNFETGRGLELAVVGERGADFVAEGKPVRSVRLKKTFTDRVAVVDLEGDGRTEFLSRGSWLHAVSVFDSTGAIRWKYEDPSGVDYAAVGDVNGDGHAEVVIGFNGGGGVHLVDSQGKMLWKRPDGNVWHVEVADLEGDGRVEIIHSNAGGALRIRDADGKIVREIKPEVYVSDFAVVACNDDPRERCVLVTSEERIVVLRSDGSVCTDWPAPGLPDYGDVLNTTIRFSAGKRYYATLVTRSPWNRSVLFIHNSDGKRVFSEVIGEECGALGTIPAGSGENLLVGCQGKVWSYRPLAAPSTVR